MSGYKRCDLIFSATSSEKILILRRIERDTIENVYWSSRKAPIILVRCYENPSSESRIVPCGQTDGRTDMNLIVAFRSLVNVPKISGKSWTIWQPYINPDSSSPGFEEQSVTAAAAYSCIILKIKSKILSLRVVFIVSTFRWVTSILTWICGK
jgi:hypothetical protein